MPSRDPSATPDNRKASTSSASSSTGKDGLDKVELSDLDASPPRLPVEQDLMQLARLGELRAIQRLFDSGKFSARSTDAQGITALHWAAINGHHALCHFLIQSGADVNAKGGDAQATPVLWASKRCHLQVVSLLLANGADPLAKDDQGYNLLHSATLDGNVFQLVLLLHQPDLPVDAPDSQGHTSLMWAAYKGFGACIDVLLRWGANVHATDDMGFTALHWALVKGNYVCIQKLIEYGSDRFARSNPTDEQPEGDSPAMTATRMKSDRQWRKALLDSGYDEAGNPLTFPLPFVKDRRWFYMRFFFLWPIALGGLQLWMLATLPLFFGLPSVLVVGYALQYLVQKSLRWAPSNMKHMHKTPFMAGIFAGTLFWVGVRWLLDMLPWTYSTDPFLNLGFIASYTLCAYFYFLTMTADPGFIPKSSSRGQTKKTVEDLIDNTAFDEIHFCVVCMIRKPRRSKHCRRCERCVAREDHHCPWVDNCVGVNNHKHFLLYVVFMVIGIGLLIRLTIAYLEVLPEPEEFECSVLNDALCAQFMKDPLTIVTNAWGSLQLTWTFMLLFVHLTQVARNITTFETMRGNLQAGPIMAAVTTGTLSAESAQLNGPDTTTSKPHAHHHKKKEGCLTQWSKLLGLDTFITIAFQGYKGSQQSKAEKHRRKRENPFTRGVVRNCQDFWMDGPMFRRKEEGCTALLGGEIVDYASMYDVPRRDGMQYRGGYESVAAGEEGDSSRGTDGYHFYIRSWTLSANELTKILDYLEENDMVFEEMAAWREMVELYAPEGDDQDTILFTIRYIGTVKGPGRPYDRYVADLTTRSSGVLHEFSQAIQILCPGFAGGNVQLILDASLDPFVSQRIRDDTERVLIEAFGQVTLLNRQDGGLYTSFLPTDVAADAYRRVGVRFYYRFTEDCSPPQQPMRNLVIGHFKSIRDFATANASETGAARRAFGDTLRNAMTQQAMPYLYKESVVPMVVLGKDIPLKDYFAQASFWTGENQASSLAADTHHTSRS
ncbi:hypothetical protein LTR08_004912 [Meristemomyces frigidus]|nr:hypothetical protein LTR08_004912 [Meristemomyces frigidus]